MYFEKYLHSWEKPPAVMEYEYYWILFVGILFRFFAWISASERENSLYFLLCCFYHFQLHKNTEKFSAFFLFLKNLFSPWVFFSLAS